MRYSMNNASFIKQVSSINWEFTDSNTQYLTHNIHRYSGKFIPQIAKKVIELTTEPGDIILDSYMGSGTTLLEAQLSGRNAVGVDLNPLAVLISTVKNMRIRPEDIEEIESTLIPYVCELLNGGQISLTHPQVLSRSLQDQLAKNQWRMEDSWNRKWYQQDVLMQLVEIYSCIEQMISEQAQLIARVAFSDILRKSSNASSKYPNVMYDKNCKKKPLPAKAYLDSIHYVLNCLKASSDVLSQYNTAINIIQGNNLNLPIDSESIDAIITHPPYIAAIPYAEYGCLSLNWLGYDSKALDSELTGGKRHSSKVVENFANDYERYFIESFRVLKTGKYMFLMVGNPVSHGESIDLNQMSIEFATKVGFTHVVTAVRRGQNRRGNKMGEEYLIFLQK